MNDIAGRPAEDLGKLLLRLVLGILILFHGYFKLMGGIAFITKVTVGAGLPAWFAYFVYIGEVLAPLLLIAGVWTRLAAAIIAINMVTALWLVHSKQIFTLTDQGGWALELQGMYLGVALAIILLGAGRYSAGGRRGTLN